jgi:uncharacterized protein (TIGR02611 family)
VRTSVIVSGAIVILVGVVLLPLPGPGWLIIFSGVAIWSVEFRWARRLLDFARVHVARWRAWYGRQGRPMKILFGVLTAAIGLVFAWAALRMSLGRDPWLILAGGGWLGPLVPVSLTGPGSAARRRYRLRVPAADQVQSDPVAGD